MSGIRGVTNDSSMACSCRGYEATSININNSARKVGVVSFNVFHVSVFVLRVIKPGVCCEI